MQYNGTFAKFLYVVAIIGAINWGLVGVFNFNLVNAIFGGGTREIASGLSRIIYALVGIAGVLAVIPLLRSIRAHRPAT